MCNLTHSISNTYNTGMKLHFIFSYEMYNDLKLLVLFTSYTTPLIISVQIKWFQDYQRQSFPGGTQWYVIKMLSFKWNMNIQ